MMEASQQVLVVEKRQEAETTAGSTIGKPGVILCSGGECGLDGCSNLYSRRSLISRRELTSQTTCILPSFSPPKTTSSTWKPPPHGYAYDHQPTRSKQASYTAAALAQPTVDTAILTSTSAASKLQCGPAGQHGC